MQTFSALLAVVQGPAVDPIAPVLDALSRSSLFQPRYWIISTIVGQIIAILAFYLSSKVLADPERSTFGAALRVWVVNWLFTIVIAIAMVVGILIAQSFFGITVVAITVVLLLILAFIIFVRIPMDVYEMGVVKAIGFILLSFILTLVGSGGASVALSGDRQEQVRIVSMMSRLSPEQQKEVFRRFATERTTLALAAVPLDGEKEAADKSKSLPERAEALKRMYVELENQRQTLKPNDETRRDVYRQQKARYEAMLQEIRSEAAQAQKAARQ